MNKFNKKENTVAYKVFWQNGETDVRVIRLSKTTYRIIDYCCERKTPDGTGINEVIKGHYEAHRTARQFASFLKSYKIPCA